MKIAKGLRESFTDQRARCDALSDEIKSSFKSEVEMKGWFFASRVKELESFALKIETGRFHDYKNLDDFFACTVIVPTLTQVEEAEGLVKSHFDIIKRKPTNDRETHKRPHSFEFDDIRLIVRKKPSPARPSITDSIKFEVQVKTILQHAWSIATHDLIYKTDSVSWPLARIAYQVKALLENVELSISQAPKLSTAPAVAKEHRETKEVLKIIEVIKNTWDVSQLPKDLKRLAETIRDLLGLIKKPAEDLQALLESEILRIGVLPTDLSPYSFLVQALANNTTLKLENEFGEPTCRVSLILNAQMELPLWMKPKHKRLIWTD